MQLIFRSGRKHESEMFIAKAKEMPVWFLV